MSELKYDEPAERFAPIVEKSLYAGATAVMVPSETGCWVHYVEYCERIANIKSEADKVIAGLKEKLKVQTSSAEEAWKLRDAYRTSYAESVKELYEINKELRHHKYKRCLDKAKWCNSEMARETFACFRPRHTKEVWREEHKYWAKWRKIWFELYKKLKPNNSTAQ